MRHIFRLSSLEDAAVEPQRLWNNRKSEHGPFDIIGDVHGCFDGTAGRRALTAERDAIARGMQRVAGLDELASDTNVRLHAVDPYTHEYLQYCWPVNSLADLKLAPFHLLATESGVHTDKPHTWHMEMLGRLCAEDDLLLKTPFQLVHLDDSES